MSLANPHDIGLKASRLPSTVQWVMIGIFVVLVAASAGFAAFEHWRRASFALGTGLLWLTVVRLTCDSERVGILAVRSRHFDAVFTAAVGAAMLFLSTSVDALGS
ncbi:hypothetical protein HMPREF2976_05375 [Corynebacterium sp. HMSC077D10]|uniref:DUF3017 domain-containing protein n=1 Tax=uncultured Corynebacterium sp. TaxID=159447 RepID=UPI000832761A|nr:MULTISPECIES: DUF3017 domain-containing protein [Corynebacterium]OFL79910.1 hypothetical protein HMPREF2748_08905 [Corynebacterium sp. HMSC077B05]OFN44894.1 hypothetical protein HMPREF2559_07955 [Corynebacterium sp. HMSC072G08]OFP17882.1 hypothetical protein HMPREF2998_02000 [Corynebacterium sp. HMSC065A05]OFP70815.1 hypothetical protein HMPREF2976_05375 [Corynebacterium sp. HMSC077D10]